MDWGAGCGPGHYHRATGGGTPSAVCSFGETLIGRSPAWYVPGAVVGALIGCYGLSQIHVEGFQALIGVGLVIMAISHGLGRKEHKPGCKSLDFFLPASFFNAIGSGLIGSTGPIMNPMYLNYGLEKKRP